MASSTYSTFDGHFTFTTRGGKISRDIAATEQEFANALAEFGEQWITEHTNNRVSGLGDVSIAYHYGFSSFPTRSRPRRRLRKAV